MMTVKGKQQVSYFSIDYVGYKNKGNPDFLNVLKNDFGNTSQSNLLKAEMMLKKLLEKELPKLLEKIGKKKLAVCVVPRSKNILSYEHNQLMFHISLTDVLLKLKGKGFEDVSHFCWRVKDTKTTHFKSSPQYMGKGKLPYFGIAKDTCVFLDNFEGKDILLIDDIYTKSVNIDEDMVETLLDKGAKSVTFYAVASTKYRGGR